MSKINELAMQEKECMICGEILVPGFLTGKALEETLNGHPICSNECYKQYVEVMEELADLKSQNPSS